VRLTEIQILVVSKLEFWRSLSSIAWDGFVPQASLETVTLGFFNTELYVQDHQLSSINMSFD